jgi:hypothetical protein
MAMPANPLDVARIVARALDACGIRYSIGGSIASSLTGEPRATLDVDILVDLAANAMAPFLAALGPEFFVDPAAFTRAVRERSAVNIFHQPTSTKIDLFVAGDSVLDRAQLERRMRIDVGGAGGIWVHSPEDILLQKLHWYRIGGRVSDRQWRDVLGMLLVQRGRLDVAYLERMAARVGLSDLLHRAHADAGQ